MKIKYIMVIIIVILASVIAIDARDAQNANHQILRASLIGDLAGVKEALNNGADIETPNENGWTPLLRAANQGHSDIVRFLCSKGAKLKAKGQWESALSHAAWHGHLKTVKELLPYKNQLKGDNLYDPVIYAANNGHLDVVKAFIEDGYSPDTQDDTMGYGCAGDCTGPDYKIIIPAATLSDKEIYEVKKNRQLRDASLKINNDKSISLKTEYLLYPGEGTKNHLGHATLLVYAAQNGHNDVVSYLLDKGANINHIGIFGRYPLYVAIIGNHNSTVRLLLDRGANINKPGKRAKSSPIICAVEAGNTKIVRELLKRGAKKASVNESKQTALDIAKKMGNMDIVKLLMDRNTP